MIDEKKLIKRLEDMQDKCNTLEERLFFDGILAIVDTQPKVNEWIPVEERIPEKGKDVLVTYIGYNAEKHFCNGVAFYDFGKWWWSINVSIVKVKIIAWMPLPEPYRTKNKNIEFNFSYKWENHHIVVSYAYGSNDGYYWDKQYFIIIDNKPYIFLVIGSWSGFVEKNNSLKQVDFDYLKDRKKENTSNFYNDVSVSDFKNDRETFEKLYKFMLDNDAKEVLEDDDNLKVIER